MTVPDEKLQKLIPSTSRETVCVVFVPNKCETECSMVVDPGQMDSPEVSDILVFGEEESEDD